MENTQEGHATTHVPGDDRTHEPAEEGGKRGESLNTPLADEDVHTQEQRNQAWTSQPPSDPRRDNEGEPLRADSGSAPPLDQPPELENQLDQIQANPHSDAVDATDTQGEPREQGGLPKTGSGEQDPMGQAGGGQFGG